MTTGRPLVVRDLAKVVTMEPGCGEGPLGVVTAGAVIITDERIEWVGSESRLPDVAGAELVRGHGGVLIPGFVDAHTHLLYAGSREHEFVLRVAGATYEQIAAAGGGILSTVRATRRASVEELLAIGIRRLDSCLAAGTTTVEIKSGYGLATGDEIRMLGIIQELDRRHAIDVVPTFMGAHAVPDEYKGRASDYARLVAEEMIPEVAARGLAEFCDVFCDQLGFSPADCEKILEAAQRHGMRRKVHAEQFSLSGGAALAIRTNAVSADHLDHISGPLIEDMARSTVTAVLTPGVNFFLGLRRWPPARALLERGVEVALATDFSPGACMTESMPMIMTIACTQMGLSPDEALRAATLGGARSLDRGQMVGSLAVGKLADMVICAVDEPSHLAYHFGLNHVTTVIKRGRVEYTAEHPTICHAEAAADGRGGAVALHSR